MEAPTKSIWTIGHSTRSLTAFISILQSFQIRHLVDIRTYPGSRRYPHFNKESLERSLESSAVKYSHIVQLGGRRKPNEDSSNTAWRNASFRGYADHMETPEFREAIVHLERLAMKDKVAYMCSEAPWWKCHRALVSDYLKINGWIVTHIMDAGKSVIHPFTSPAKSVQGKLFYD